VSSPCVSVYLCNISKEEKKNSTKEILKICKCAEGNLNNFRAKLNVCTLINLCWKHFVSIEYQFIDLIDHFVNRWLFLLIRTRCWNDIFFYSFLSFWSLWLETRSVVRLRFKTFMGYPDPPDYVPDRNCCLNFFFACLTLPGSFLLLLLFEREIFLLRKI
jgi:hypothetical protein